LVAAARTPWCCRRRRPRPRSSSPIWDRASTPTTRNGSFAASESPTRRHIFLSWQRSEGLDGNEHDFYVRQLWDWKASIDLANVTEAGLHAYTRACGWALARAHARSGDRLSIAAYLGKSASFDQAIVRFATAYADQNERDYWRLADAVATAEVAAVAGV
jgi:hypothetical protein